MMGSGGGRPGTVKYNYKYKKYKKLICLDQLVLISAKK